MSQVLNMVKKDPELRHILAHMDLAIRSLAEGLPADALYEMDSIKNLIYFETDEEQAALAKEIYDGEM